MKAHSLSVSVMLARPPKYGQAMVGEIGHPYVATTVFIGLLPRFNGAMFEACSALSTHPDIT